LTLTNYALPGERPHPRYRAVADVSAEPPRRAELLDQALDEELPRYAEALERLAQ